jgi:hypothetical protein
MTLSGCSSNQKVVTETVYQKQYIPVGVLKVDCTELEAGETVRSLATSWTNNTSCLRAYKRLIDGLIMNYTEKDVK